MGIYMGICVGGVWQKSMYSGFYFGVGGGVIMVSYMGEIRGDICGWVINCPYIFN